MTADSAFANGAGIEQAEGNIYYDVLLAQEPDGRIVLAGENYSGLLTVERYLANGSNLDSNFNGGEPETVTDGVPQADAIAIQPGGRIVVAGADAAGDWALIAFKDNGQIDTGFAGGGDSISLGVSGSPAAMAIQPDGNILIAGTKAANAATDAFFARYASGGLDAAVSSLAPTLLSANLEAQSLGGPIAVTAYTDGDPVTLDGTFTDPGSEEACTLTVNWDAADTANPNTDVTSETLPPGSSSFSIPAGQCPADGTFEISVTLSNAGGNSTTLFIDNITYNNALISGP